MMKKCSSYLFAILVISLAFLACKNNPFGKNVNTEYRNSKDDRTLFATKAPYIMPYNRILDPAGVSIAFGDGTLENHSLDAVKLADNKTLAVEDRFGIAFFDLETKKNIDRLALNSDVKYRGAMSTFSGISTIVHHDSTFVFWGAGGKEIILENGKKAN